MVLTADKARLLANTAKINPLDEVLAIIEKEALKGNTSVTFNYLPDKQIVRLTALGFKSQFNNNKTKIVW